MENKPMEQSNPLSKHYRQPALYITLPSRGNYWSDNAIELPVSGELPVYPMTTRDEITLKTPDALLNGEGVVQTIQSCCPSIKDAWRMPSIDTDYVLIAIRIASYGHELKFDSECPSCKEVSSYEQDLRQVLDSIQTPNFNQTLKTNGLEFKFKPQMYLETNTLRQIQFEEQRMMGILEDPELEEEVKRTRVKDNLNKMLELSLKSLTVTTESITVDGTTVTDTAQMLEFYQNSDSKVIKAVKEFYDNIVEVTNIKPFKLNCTSCGHTYETGFEFDYTSFFV